jgi:hypothetical protein
MSSVYVNISRGTQHLRRAGHIVEEGVNLAVLSSVLGALPRLREVGVDFQATVLGQEWLEEYSYLGRMTMGEKSCEYHIRVVLNAIRNARNSGVPIYILSLSGFNPLNYSLRQDPDLSNLLASLRELLDCVQILRLTNSESILELLSYCALKL